MRSIALAALAATALGCAQARASDLVRLQTAFGEITVARSFGDRVVPLLGELKRLGVKARVKCFAATRGSHVAHSLHFIGEACDVLPIGHRGRGRNRMPTPALMFSRQVAAAIARAGLRNGCAFRDCGHIDSGRSRQASARRSRG